MYRFIMVLVATMSAILSYALASNIWGCFHDVRFSCCCAHFFQYDYVEVIENECPPDRKGWCSRFNLSASALTQNGSPSSGASFSRFRASFNGNIGYRYLCRVFGMIRLARKATSACDCTTGLRREEFSIFRVGRKEATLCDLHHGTKISYLSRISEISMLAQSLLPREFTTDNVCLEGSMEESHVRALNEVSRSPWTELANAGFPCGSTTSIAHIHAAVAYCHMPQMKGSPGGSIGLSYIKLGHDDQICLDQLSSTDASCRVSILPVSLSVFLFLFVSVAFLGTCGKTATSLESSEIQNGLGHGGKEVLSMLCYYGIRQKSTRCFCQPASLVVVLLSLNTFVLCFEASDLRGNIINGLEPCFNYTRKLNLFQMNCSVLNWRDHGYKAHFHISLGANEAFEGGGDQANNEGNTTNIIDLRCISGFQGLIRIKDDVTTLDTAPVIRNVHVRNGTIAEKGGFIVRQDQKYFVVHSCSSTGDITHRWAGGICGANSGEWGQISVSSSYSTGKMKGNAAGGIAGFGVGRNGIADISRCYSTGDMEKQAGGICGFSAGIYNGQLSISQSYSTGDIISGAVGSGGIVGSWAGNENGFVHIQECSSTGRIYAYGGGGITGYRAASSRGEVHIIDCYTRGDIAGRRAGGITGALTGGRGRGSSNDCGDVYINNTYASGVTLHQNAGGIVGGINKKFKGHIIWIQYSVYSGKTSGKIIGNDEYPENNLVMVGNSGYLANIRGQLYHYKGIRQWDNETWEICDARGLPILSFQLPCPTPTPSPTSTSTATPTISSSALVTPTSTTTATSSGTATPTVSRTASHSSSAEAPTPSPSQSAFPLVPRSEVPMQRPCRFVQQDSTNGKQPV
eukprot:gb/GECG01004786.1/.p1 GENE.gb/GECG01004786.1/~~gb/GECG01004786.1/.p1  ORF type:complete len:857 (+),score=59.33 gb/GECG01004786.1/:1-2571(+)